MFLTFCRTPQYKETKQCTVLPEHSNIIDFLSLNETETILVKLNPTLRDHKKEIIHDAKIYLTKSNINNHKNSLIEILNRDDYPFKPFSIGMYQNEKNIYIYILNIAFLKQRSIEIYQYENEKLRFISRIRSKEFKDLKSITINTNQEIIGIQKNKIFLHKSRTYKNLDLSLPEIFRIRKIQNNYYGIATKEKKIYKLSEDLKVISTFSFDFYPLDIFFYNGEYLILLSSVYKDPLSLSSNQKNQNQYIYILNEEDMISKSYFSIYDAFKKLKIPIVSYFSSLDFKKSHLLLILHSWETYSMSCKIDKDFFIN